MSISRNTIFSGFITFAICAASSAAYAQQNFDVIIMGDPQFFRTTKSGKFPNTHNTLSLQNNQSQVTAIRKYAAQNTDYLGTIINGDLTEYGQNGINSDQIAQFLIYYHNNQIPKNIWPGLGNHDYANNVYDTWENSGALRMVQFMTKDTIPRLQQSGQIVDADVRSKYVKYIIPSVIIEGSLSYSWDIGDDYRFIQLNNYPDYKRVFNGWYWGWDGNPLTRDITHRIISIESSIDNGWLKGQLDKAVTDGKKVVLNMHHTHPKGNPNQEWNKLNTLMKNYTDIKAVFMGHIHERLGQCDMGYGTSIGNSVPVFYSGTPIYNSMLVAKFSAQNGMTVDLYSTKDATPTRLGTAINTCKKFP